MKMTGAMQSNLFNNVFCHCTFYIEYVYLLVVQTDMGNSI